MSPLRLPLLLLVLLAPLGCGEQVAPPPATPTQAPAPTEFSRPYPGHVPELWAERRATFLITDERTGKPIEGAVITRHVEMVMGPEGWGPEADRVVTDAYGLASIELKEDDHELKTRTDPQKFDLRVSSHQSEERRCAQDQAGSA